MERKVIDKKEKAYADERAKRAKVWAEMFPNLLRPSDLRFQDPLWQWENEVRGRFGDVVGGSLSGSRPTPES